MLPFLGAGRLLLWLQVFVILENAGELLEELQ